MGAPGASKPPEDQPPDDPRAAYLWMIERQQEKDWADPGTRGSGTNRLSYLAKRMSRRPPGALSGSLLRRQAGCRECRDIDRRDRDLGLGRAADRLDAFLAGAQTGAQ
jgi:hypothetical protein